MTEPTWKTEIKPTALKSLRRLAPHLQDRIRRTIDELPAGNVKRLQGSDEFRCRVGDWRIRFSKDAASRVITVLAVTSRGDAYKKR
jgi:mRNA interferase RelE/StbE